MSFILALAALAAAQTCPSPAASVQAKQPVILAAFAAQAETTATAAQAGSTATATDPNAKLNYMQSTITELIAKNNQGALELTPAEFARVKAALAGMSRDIAKLQKKYRTATGPVDRAALDAEVEALLDKNHARDKALILSLRSKGITAQGHECENFCWEACGHNSVGEWVCFLSCRRQCGGV